MASLDSLKVRALNAKGAVNVTRDDTPVILRLNYIGTGSVTSVTPTTATNLITITTEGTKTYTFSSLSTVGALADAINADGIFHAQVLDALRSDATNASNIVENTAITAGSDDYGSTVYDLHADTSVNKSMTSTLSLFRNVNVGLKTGHRVELQEIVYYLDVNGASANSVRVYFRNTSGIETQVAGYASVDVTKTTINWAAGVGVITAPEKSDIIVRVQDATSVTDGSGNYVQATGILQ
jgi:hypothetical protein